MSRTSSGNIFVTITNRHNHKSSLGAVILGHKWKQENIPCLFKRILLSLSYVSVAIKFQQPLKWDCTPRLA